MRILVHFPITSCGQSGLSAPPGVAGENREGDANCFLEDIGLILFQIQNVRECATEAARHAQVSSEGQISHCVTNLLMILSQVSHTTTETPQTIPPDQWPAGTVAQAAAGAAGETEHFNPFMTGLLI